MAKHQVRCPPLPHIDKLGTGVQVLNTHSKLTQNLKCTMTITSQSTMNILTPCVSNFQTMESIDSFTENYIQNTSKKNVSCVRGLKTQLSDANHGRMLIMSHTDRGRSMNKVPSIVQWFLESKSTDILI